MIAVTVTPLPNHTRQRVATSPNSKDFPATLGNIASVKYGDRKEQHIYRSPSLRSINNHPSTRSSQWKWIRLNGCCEQITVLLMFVTTIAFLCCILGRLFAIYNISSYEPSVILSGRSLHVERIPSDQNSIDQSSALNDDKPNPKIVWLMSFPNSGTSFIIHTTREATNCTTATNYGLEGEIRDRPSVQAIEGPSGENGPWLELLRSKTTRIADTILTKTHCKGFCSGSYCGAEKTFHTPRSFMIGCLTGNQGVVSGMGLRLIDKTYDKSLVKKAIHIFRHPLDNVVARFHLEYNEKRDAGNIQYTKKFPKNVLGFRRWCYLDDHNRGLIRSRFIDRRLRSFMLQIPCFNEFYRYTQWHNLAFETTRSMNIPTMLLHYHEFADNFTKARNRVVDFLELPLVGEGIQFDDGKIYGHYYTSEEKTAIHNFLEEFATAETWEQLKGYNFGEVAPRSKLNVSIPIMQ